MDSLKASLEARLDKAKPEQAMEDLMLLFAAVKCAIVTATITARCAFAASVIVTTAIAARDAAAAEAKCRRCAMLVHVLAGGGVADWRQVGFHVYATNRIIRHAAVRHKREAGGVLASLVIEVVLGHGWEVVTHEARGRNQDEAAARNAQAQSGKGRGTGYVDDRLMGISAAVAAAAINVAAAAVNATMKGRRDFWEVPPWRSTGLCTRLRPRKGLGPRRP